MSQFYVVFHSVGNQGDGNRQIMLREICDDEQEAFEYAEEDPGNLWQVLHVDSRAGTCTDITRKMELALEEAVADARSLARHNASFARPSGY